MSEYLLKLLAPHFDFFILHCIAISIIALVLPKLKVTSFLGPVSTVLFLSWFNDKYWHKELFFFVPNSLTLNILLLILANSLILYVVVKLMPGIEIVGLITAIQASLMFTASSYLISRFKHLIEWPAIFDFTNSILIQIRNFFMAIL